MNSKRIANIVFYKFFGEKGAMKQACIFYTDGSVKNVSYEEGLEACEEIVKENHITSKDAFKEMINREKIYVMSGREFEQSFSKYISVEEIENDTGAKTMQKTYQPNNIFSKKSNSSNEEPFLSLDSFANNGGYAASTDELKNNSDDSSDGDVNDDFINLDAENTNLSQTDDSQISSFVPPININPSNAENDTLDETEEDSELDEDFVNGLNEEEISEVPPILPSDQDDLDDDTLGDDNVSSSSTDPFDIIHPTEEDINEDSDMDKDENIDEDSDMDIDENIDEDSDMDIDEDIDIDVEDNDIPNGRTELDDNEDAEDFDDGDIDEDIEDLDDEDFEDLDASEKKEKKGIIGFIKKQVEKVKKWSIVKKITAFALAIAMGLGLYSVAAHQTKEGKMLNSNLSTQTMDETNSKRGSDEILISGNNDYYDNYSYDQLLSVTENNTQKTAMTHLGTTIKAFNGPFADAYVEEGKNIRAALSFDEIVALQQAYNDYSKEELKAYFNGSNIKSFDLTKAYKNASLQLMGAYVIETKENPVDMSGLIEDEDGKAFYQHYNEMFLAAKAATGQDKLDKIKIFYEAVRKDFPVTSEVRTEGIAHADNYEKIVPYKLAVTPMIAAAEMMFQNYEIDYTLNDSEIDFLNDLGLCNYAEDKFEQIEIISLTSEEDNSNPLYEQYKAAIEDMLKEENIYVIDDEHRELSKLDAFQSAVNGNAVGINDGTWDYEGSDSYSTTTRQEKSTRTETETTYRTEETRTEKDIPESEKTKIDQEIEKENQEAKEKAEEAAKENQDKMQAEEDQKAEEIKKEVEEDEKDLQDKIDNANDQINENNSDENKDNDTPINEDDFGDHNVDFDDEHSDENGNLDDSVENITTDPTGDQTGEELPDPNETGKKFDDQSSNGNNSSSSDSSSSNSNQNIYEYEEPVAESKSNEELVDEYIESLANMPNEDETSYQYTK